MDNSWMIETWIEHFRKKREIGAKEIVLIGPFKSLAGHRTF